MKLITLALVGASLIGCGESSKNHDSMSMTDTAMYDITQADTTDGGTWSVTYTSDLDPIPMTDNFKLYVTISDIETSELVSGAELNASASMPEHNHGMNTTPVVTELGEGQYEVAGMQFHMSGHWIIDLEINAFDKTEGVVFHVDCCQ